MTTANKPKSPIEFSTVVAVRLRRFVRGKSKLLRRRLRACRGFTLTELLVLAPILPVVGVLLLASLGNQIQTLQAAQCLSNMRQWGLAIALYCNDYQDQMPYHGTPNYAIDQNYNLQAWYNVLPHYVNQTPLMDLYDSSPPAIPLPGQRSIYVCPSLTPGSQGSCGTSTSNPWFAYAMNSLLNGCAGSLYKRSICLKPSQTILLSESENNGYSFTDGFHLSVSSRPQVTPRHSGGMNFVFVDGHAEWLPQATYQRLSIEMEAAAVEWARHSDYYWWPCPTCYKPPC